MAIFNDLQRTDTITLAEDASQYFAVARDDGKVANNGEEAAGILIADFENGDFATIATDGVCKFRAGGAIAAGGKITVSTSGWMTAGDSGSYIVGEARSAVTSGSIGSGKFEFATAAYLAV